VSDEPQQGMLLVMRTPRQLLAVLSVALVVIGGQTLRYPPDFLAFSELWSIVTIAAGVTCAAASVRPRRLYVATSGAFVVTSSAARGIALVVELFRDGHTGEAAGFVVGAITWGMVAILAFVTWREYVLPWSIGRDDFR
jgi:hypothetical protein